MKKKLASVLESDVETELDWLLNHHKTLPDGWEWPVTLRNSWATSNIA
jgi:hypothetical protein